MNVSELLIAALCYKRLLNDHDSLDSLTRLAARKCEN